MALKVQGVSAEQARELKNLGLQLDGSDLIALKIQGVTPTYVRDIEALGLKPGKVMHILYTAIEGRSQGLPLFDSIAMLGRESALQRLRAARARL